MVFPGDKALQMCVQGSNPLGRITRKALILLHFGNPEPHNKELALRHPNVG
jgi:hypothetical protein